MADQIVSGLLETLGTLAVREFSLLRSLAQEIQRLQGDLSMMNDVLTVAEEMKYRDKSVETWLEDLRDVGYDAVDVFDELKMVTALHPNLLSHTDDGIAVSSVRQVRACFLSCFTPTPNPVLFRHKMVTRIKGITGKLNALAAREERRRVLLGTSGQVNQSETSNDRETASTPTKDVPFLGRGLEKRRLLDTLCASATPDHRVPLLVPIVGLGGVGKTTLAQAVFNDGRVQECFPMRKWVFVGEKFDAGKIIEQLLPKDSRKEISTGNKPSLEDLHMCLRSEIRHKRFLIILDDVWSEKSEEWSKFWGPLEHGGTGSRVIVTTRSPQVAKMKGPVPLTITLEPLSSEECWSIFEKCAFIEKSSEEYPEMKAIGWEIVRKLNGIPLAAKLIGEALGRKFDQTYWKGLMDSDIWLQELEREGVLPSLLLSYQGLPSHLRPCFAFCSLFPKDDMFDPETLVWMWMAHDFIQPVGSERMEDVGRRWFDELVQRSFFQYVDHSYVMHDLIHDLAEFVSRGECLRVEDEKKPCSKPDSVHHISLHFDEDHVLEPKYLNQFNRARTLRVSIGRFTVASDQNFCRLLGRLKSVRVLDLLGCWFLKSLPEDINNLKHLRYLDITCTDIKKLPESLCMVYHLQTLMVGYKCALPKGMSRLVNLRNLHADKDCISQIAGIGKLTCLQKLNGPFRVLSEDVEVGRSIRELRGMNQLGGTLCIQNLAEVGSAEEAAEAGLKDKVFLHGLELAYGEDVFEKQDAKYEQVMEALQPPPQIKELTLRRYPGQSPNWMSSLLPTLHTLSIGKCQNLFLTSLPPTLQKLRIDERPNLQSLLTSLPPTLQELCIEKCPNLQSLPSNLPPRLKDLLIEECSNLQSLPTSLPPTLQSLRIEKCLNFQSLPISLPPTLQSLRIEKCPNLQSLQVALPSTLVYLTIQEFPNLQALLSIPPSLSKLQIMRCPRLEEVAWLEAEPDLIGSASATPSPLEEVASLEVEPDLIGSSSSTPLPLEEVASLEVKPDLIGSSSSIPSSSSSSSTAPVELRVLTTDNRQLLSWLLLQPRRLDSLRILEIKDCVELETFTEEEKEGWHRNFSSHLYLRFSGCPNLLSLPGTLPVMPDIRDCPKFQSD